MANSISGMLAVYAQDALKQLVAQAPLFSAWTTDYSPQIQQGGISVTTRLPSTVYTLNDTHANGYTAQEASSSAVTVTLKQRDITHVFSDLEWSTMTPEAIRGTWIPSMVGNLVNGIAKDVMALVTYANYGSGSVISNANFSASAAVTMATSLSLAKVPTNERSLIVTPGYFGSLVASAGNAFQTPPFGEVVTNYTFGKFAGMNVFEYADLPTNSQALVGFACGKSGIAVAMRQPAVSEAPAVSAANAVDPSGISIQLRTEQALGKWYLSATCIYGAAKGNAGALIPLHSA